MTKLYIYFKQLDPNDSVSVGFDLGLRLLGKEHDYNHVALQLGPHVVEQTMEGLTLHDCVEFDLATYPLQLEVNTDDTEETILDRLTTLFALNLHLTPQDLILWSLGYRPVGSLFCTDMVLLVLGAPERQYLTPCELLEHLRSNYRVKERLRSQSTGEVIAWERSQRISRANTVAAATP